MNTFNEEFIQWQIVHGSQEYRLNYNSLMQVRVRFKYTLTLFSSSRELLNFSNSILNSSALLPNAVTRSAGCLFHGLLFRSLKRGYWPLPCGCPWTHCSNVHGIAALLPRDQIDNFSIKMNNYKT